MTDGEKETKQKHVVKNRIRFVSAILTAVVVVFAVHSLDFPGSVPNFERVSGGGVLLDVKPSFSEEAIYQRLSDYGEEGRKNYAFRNITVDILLPLAVFPSLFLLMLTAVEGSSIVLVYRRILLSFSFLYVIFDVAENGTVLMLLSYFPDRLHLLVGILPYITVAKRAASVFALVIPLIIFIVTIIQKRRAKS